MPKFQSAKVAKCQSYKVPKLQSAKVAKCQICKVAKCQSYIVPKTKRFKVENMHSYKVLKCQSCKVQTWQIESAKLAIYHSSKYVKIVCHCLYHASTRIDVVTHMPLWTYISCHPFRDVPIFSSRHLPVTFACAAASRIAIMAGISNHQRTCRSIASWKTAELSLAQFDYMA